MLALGIGAAIVGGAGVAHAERPSSDSTRTTAHSSDSGTDTGAAKRKPRPFSAPTRSQKVKRGGQESLRGPREKPIRDERRKILRHTADTAPMGRGVLKLVHRELETDLAQANPAVTPGIPSPDDHVSTAYGDIGKWMLKSDGEIANWGGQLYGGKTLLEPVNVIIVDPTSTSPAEATRKLNAAMFCAGFPAQPIHSTGFQGSIDDVTYHQQPTGQWQSYSNNFFLFPNDHGRVFGPDPVETSTGYVWSGSFSTEALGIYDGLLVHIYVSSGMARNALARRLICSGRATYGGLVTLDNAYNTATTTTGDHDGYAVVLVLK